MKYGAVPKMYERTISRSTQKELEHEYIIMFSAKALETQIRDALKNQ